MENDCIVPGITFNNSGIIDLFCYEVYEMQVLIMVSKRDYFYVADGSPMISYGSRLH